jgi:carbon storage regulator
MLVLRRRAGESLLIGQDIEIEFLDLTAQAVKIGIRAPKEVIILRKELQLTKAQNQTAARAIDLKKLAGSIETLKDNLSLSLDQGK